ncbi:S-layer homology domain-containing protein, partial [Chamaesiphon sp. OTE_75_metabat_556]|uniref:S-layer homology domain-containing protein n=1 Tax=Chamaesiphon sp. OTE_75_metabat_556 TaxID=2964692 RepID=UPI00286C0305
KSRRDDPNLKYEREFQKRAEEGDGKFSIFVRQILSGKQQEWGISPEEANQIEDRVLQPYREYQHKITEYEQTLTEAVQHNKPFSDREQADLKEYQQQLKLRDEDVAEIHQRVQYIPSELLITPVNNLSIEPSPQPVTHQPPIKPLITPTPIYLRNFIKWLPVIVTGLVALFALPQAIKIAVKPNEKDTSTLKQVNQSIDIAGNWAEPFIKSLVGKNIIKGYPDGSFKPDRPITRSEFAALLNSAFDLQPIRAGRTFEDVPPNYWAAEVIQKAYQSGFVSGYPNGTFAPMQNTLRIQSLVSLVNGSKLEPSGTLDLNSVFGDAAQVPSYGQNALIAATQKCMATSPEYNSSQIPGGNFGPNTVATRADVAVYLHQALVAAGRLKALDKSSAANKYIASCPQGVYVKR